MKSTVGLIVSLICLIEMINCELRLVFTMFRHGARAPSSGLDSNNNDMLGENWQSPGELTSVGMRMHFLLGHRNSVKYSSFLPSSWDANDMYIKSSDYNRTMMSAQSQLNGMFPPGTGPVLTTSQEATAYPPDNWANMHSEATILGDMALADQMQVFPVHLWPESNENYFFFYNPAPCQPVLKVISQNTQNATITTWVNNFNTQYGAKLRTALSITDTSYFTVYNNLFLFTDTFLSDYYDGRTLQKLVNAGIDLSAMNTSCNEFHFNDMIIHYNYDSSGIPHFAIVSMSPLLTEVLAFMDRRIAADLAGNTGNKNYELPKYVMFSTHDVTVSSAQVFFRYALGDLFPYYDSPFASNLFLELSRTDGLSSYTSADYSINAVYNDHNIFSMSYNSFKAKVEAKIMSPADVANYCGFPSNNISFLGWSVSYMQATVVLACILLVLLILNVIYLIYCCCCKKNDQNKTHDYEPANNKVQTNAV